MIEQLQSAARVLARQIVTAIMEQSVSETYLEGLHKQLFDLVGYKRGWYLIQIEKVNRYTLNKSSERQCRPSYDC
jgi:hypothetical protein